MVYWHLWSGLTPCYWEFYTTAFAVPKDAVAGKAKVSVDFPLGQLPIDLTTTEMVVPTAAPPNKIREQAAAKARVTKARTWTDSSGKFQVKAKFQGMVNEVVKLEVEDGSVISVPLHKLSDDDQECIRERKY